MGIDNLKFNDKGLIPCVAQDYGDGRVLMVAYMNRESLQITLNEGNACYFSRSRKKLWRKGEESGNVQKVKGIYTDCDKDTILIKVEQIGGCACHHGYRSCFYSKYDQVRETWDIIDKKVKDPDSMYDKK